MKTLWLNSGSQDIRSKRREKFKYFFSKGIFWKLRNWLAELRNRTGFDLWKKKVLNKTIDVLFNSLVIGVIAYAWMSHNWFVKGFAITLFFIVFLSYVEEFREKVSPSKRK